jgi:O-antigen/teichoic acid export membrane protein
MPSTADPPVTDAAAGTTGATVMRSGAWNAASLVLPQLYLVAMSVVAARFLAPDDMGRQSYIAFVAVSLAQLLAGGVPVAIQRFVAETLGRGEPGHARALVAWGRRLIALAALAGGGALLAAAALGSEPQMAWVLAAGICALTILQTLPASVLAAVQRWRGLSILGIVSGALTTVAVLAVLAAGGGITGMFAVELAGTALSFGVTLRLARRALGQLAAPPVDAPHLRRRTARWAAVATFSAVLSFLVWRRSEFVLLEATAADAEIAMYSIAFGAMVALTRLPEAVGLVISPAFATLLGAGQVDRIRSGYARAIRLILLAAIPLTAAATALGPATIRAVYGDAYSDAGTLLVIMAPTLPLLALVSVSRGLIFGLGDQRALVVVGVLAAGLDAALAVLLIPRFGGVGAALTNAAAQLGSAIGYLAFSRRAVGPVAWAPAATARNVAAAAAAAAAAWMTTSALAGVAGLVTGLVVFTTAFAVLSIGLRVIPAEDGRWLAAAVGGRLPGRRGVFARRVLASASGAACT